MENKPIRTKNKKTIITYSTYNKVDKMEIDTKGYKIPIILMVTLIAIIALYPFISDIFQSVGTEPEVNYTLEPLEKTEINEKTCLVTFTGEIQIDYEPGLREMEVQARIEEKPRGLHPETFKFTRTITDPEEITEFEMELEAPRNCEDLINPEIEILSMRRRLL